MKTLILDPNRLRARAWEDRFGDASDTCHLAQSPGQARLMLIATRYDRLCLPLGELGGVSHAILSVARACNPDCEIVDLARKTRRSVSGPSHGAVMREALRRAGQATRIG